MTSKTDSFTSPDADRPLDDPQSDALGRTALARSMARLISRHRSAEGFVIALCGAWGSGKTTLLNFVEAYLKDPKETPEDDQPILLHFNPWWFHGPENLLLHFLDAFRTSLPGGRFRDLTKDLGAYADVLSPLVNLAPGIGPQLWAAWRVLRRHSQSPDEIRRKIDAHLERSPQQILVIVDDIDRLPRQEIREMFKLVKSVAAFPKTIYLLAFDKDAVATALGEGPNGHGGDYIKKIVQLEIDVPEPDPTVLRHQLRLGIERVVGGPIDELHEAERWEDTYQEAIFHILRTLRDVKRYLNALNITYPLVRNEVHSFDFAIIELLRVFTPNVYDTVRRNRERFAGGDSDWESALGGGTPTERKPFYDDVIHSVPSRLQTPMLALLKELFPKVRASFGGRIYASSLNEEWRRERRICSPEIFPTYFQLSAPIGEISEETFRAVCNLAANRERFCQELLSLAKSSQAGEVPRSRLLSFLQRLSDHPEAIKELPEPDALGACIGALFDIGDPVYSEDWENLTISDIDGMIIRTVSRLLGEGVNLTGQARSLAELGRFEHLRRTIASTPSLYVPVLQVSRLARAERETAPIAPESDNQDGTPVATPTLTMNSNRLEELKRVICEKIDRAAEHLDLAKVPRLIFVMSRWEEWCPDAESKRMQFVHRLLQSDEGLAQLLAAYLNMSEVTSGPEDPGQVQYSIDLLKLSRDMGDRDAMNAQYQRAMLMRPKEQPWLTRRRKVAIEVFGQEWLRAGSQIPSRDG